MPTYVYETLPQETSEPPRRFEVKQGMRDLPLTHDPESGLPVRRVIHANFYLSGVKKVVAPLPDSGGCCGPAGGSCHH